MIRRLLFTAALLFPLSAHAQFATIGATPPTADNSDRLATTAWVNNFFATGLPLTSGKIFIGNVSNQAAQQTVSGDCTLAATGVITCTKTNGAAFSSLSTTTPGTGVVTALGLAVNGAGGLVTSPVASANLNITTTGCTNQFVTAISAGGVGTCTTDTLASAQHANQGTTTTVLHGNAAGNPSFGAVNLSTDAGGTLQAAQEPVHTGDVTNTAGSLALTSTGKIGGVFGQIPGEPSTGSASAGNVGEYVSSTVASGSAVSLTSNTPANITSISLTAGDWDVELIPNYTGGTTTTVTSLQSFISLTTATPDQTNGRFITTFFNGGAVFNVITAALFSQGSVTVRLSLSTTTTVFGVAVAVFGTSTCSTFGVLRARRVR